MIQNVIERKPRDFPSAPIAIEQNAMGITVIQNLNLPAYRIIPFTTSVLSKARALEGIQYALEQGLLKSPPRRVRATVHGASQLPDPG